MNPKLFISYSWTDKNHEEWVLELAKDLCNNGVDVILDKWHLKEGQDAAVFMEQMVYDDEIKKVILIFDRVYAEKTNARKGGVGTEAQIISKEIYDKTDQDKFVAIIKERDQDGNPHIPIYYSNRIYIDLSDDSNYTSNFEKLLRWVYDKPLYTKPDLGNIPFFVTDNDQKSHTGSLFFSKAINAIRDQKGNATPLTAEYFEYIVSKFDELKIESYEGELDDVIIDSIDSFIPLRNEIIEFITNLARFQDNKESLNILHSFFEKLIKYLDPKITTLQRQDCVDNFIFIIDELFLYTICILIKEECFDTASYLMQTGYYNRDSETGDANMQNFVIFNGHLRSLNVRNKRLELRRLSLHSDLLKKRCNGIKIDFEDLMQADFVLFLRDHLDNDNASYYWWPYTLIFSKNKVFEVFARSESNKYFQRIKSLLGIDDKSNLEKLFQKFTNKERKIPEWQIYDFNPYVLSGISNIGTKM